MENNSNRRNFLKTTTAAAGAAALSSTIARSAHAQGSDEIKFALVGCGGRGQGASQNIFKTDGNTKLVAVADAFHKKASDAVSNLSKKFKDKVDVPADRIFSGI